MQKEPKLGTLLVSMFVGTIVGIAIWAMFVIAIGEYQLLFIGTAAFWDTDIFLSRVVAGVMGGILAIGLYNLLVWCSTRSEAMYGSAKAYRKSWNK